jgi:TRAP-type C4-dicarboxylate transport system substrate-binding protein
MKKLIKALAFSAALTAMASAAHAEKLILKFGHVGNPGSLFSASVDEFAKRANAALGDKAEVQVFGSSQLGKDKELMQKLKLGQITFSLPSSVMSSVADTFGVFEMPYIIKDRDHMKRVQADHGRHVPGCCQVQGLPHPDLLRERLPPHHQQHPPDQQA